MSCRGKNFRRRSVADDATGDDSTTATTTTTTTTKPKTQALKSASKPKPSPKPKRPDDGPKRLSFADDDEEDEDLGPASLRRGTPASRPPTSTGSTHKLSSSKNRTFTGPAPSVLSSLQPQAGEYTKERLLELQKNARPLSSIPKTQRSGPPAEPVIVLKGIVKPVSAPIDSVSKPRIEEEEDVDEEEEDMKRVDNKQFAKLGIDGMVNGVSSFPSQSDINAIKARREQLRQASGPAPDFISLDAGGVMATRSSDGGSSDEGDHDFRGRIALFGDKGDGKRKKGVFEGIEEPVSDARVVAIAGDDDEDVDEDNKWEEEQFRKGIGKRIEAIEEVSEKTSGR